MTKGVIYKYTSTFNTTKEAANAVGLKSHSSISDCCNGKTSKGYKWKYEK